MSEEAYQSPQLVQPCPGCGGLLDVSDLEPFSNIHCPSCGTALRARTQFRNFSLQDLLGAGGMGQVFRALDCNLNRMVALKVLRKEYSEPGEGMGQLEREARLTASINHPHVVRIFSFGKDHGQFYLAMELVDQGSLDDLMTLQGKVSELQVLEIAMQVAQGLQAAHQLDLIHRDVKPGNILFADAHTAKIVDFGLAILMEEEAAQRGEIWGTPYYVAPEKLDQRPEDFRSDIYSLGGTLFHAIAGRPPYEAENASLVALKHLKSQNVSLQAFAPEVGSETTYVINKMMHKDPDERYGSYEELLQHLQFAHDRCQARAEQRAPSRQRVVVESEETDSRMAWIILSLLAALVIAGFFGFNYFQEQQKSREELAPTTSRPAAHERQAVRIEEATHQYQEGLTSLAEGDAAGALEYLGSLAALPQPQASFAALFQATAHLMLDEKDQAKEILEELYQDGLFSTEPGQLAMANALVETARMLTQQNRVNPSVMRLIDLNGPYAYSLFLFGISEWMEGRVSEAGEFFQAFLQLEPQGSVAWVAAFRPQAELFVADWKDYSELREAVTKENTSAGRQEILNKINEARGQIRTHYGIIHQVYDELIAATDRLISHAQEEEVQAVEVERATRQVELDPQVSIIQEALDTGLPKLQLTSAQSAAGVLTEMLGENEVPREVQQLLLSVEWSVKFRDHLLTDSVVGGYGGPFQLQSQSVAPGRLESRTEEGLTLTTEYGRSLTRWEDLSSRTILAMALNQVAERPEEDQARIFWMAGIYAIQRNLAREGRELLIRASQSGEEFKDIIEVFFPSAS